MDVLIMSFLLIETQLMSNQVILRLGMKIKYRKISMSLIKMKKLKVRLSD